MSTEILFGTKEWAPHNFNFMNGCSNDCVYCYAKEMAIRFKRKTQSNWKIEEPVSLDGKTFKKKNGTIMLPSSHDITPGNIDIALSVIEKLLSSGNELLIVTKPHFKCIKLIVDKFADKKSQIQFRFTIGSANSAVLKSWEPGATDFPERLKSLRLAFENGFSTSISCEPLLDDQFDILYDKVKDYVTGSIWIGKMNFPSRRVRTNTKDKAFDVQVKILIESQSDNKIIKLWKQYNENPLIEWKESIKKVAIQYGLINHDEKIREFA